jgi:hypothetical protein
VVHQKSSECTKIVGGRGSALGPTEGAYSAPPYPVATISGSAAAYRERRWEGKDQEEMGHNGRRWEERGERRGRLDVWSQNMSFIMLCDISAL